MLKYGNRINNVTIEKTQKVKWFTSKVITSYKLKFYDKVLIETNDVEVLKSELKNMLTGLSNWSANLKKLD